jgi:ArsR family transcriptional regulator, arsenate/arsenite/antimonite-responsive transcriptional repressor
MGSPWKAVADDNRRQVLLLLKNGEKTPSEIASHFDFTLPALSTHLRILKEANLVSERRAGQRRFYSVNREGMSDIAGFLDEFWEENLDNLKRHVESKSKRKK